MHLKYFTGNNVMKKILLICFVIMFLVSPIIAGSEEFVSKAIGAKFVLIPAGKFMMGDLSKHRVTISKPFYMQTTTVTQGQWKKIMGKNPSFFDSFFNGCGNRCPVEQVSWNDAQEFIRKLNSMEGTDKYRLPTEAEWEYAARAGTNTPFNTGNCLSVEQANYNGTDPYNGCPKGKYREKTVAIGSFAPNSWGLYDMHGNVWQWVQDWYADYPSRNVTDPTGPAVGSTRVIRGGSWYTEANRCRSGYRTSYDPSIRHGNIGFRLAITIEAGN
jgi:formylglycine-generating enzyme